MNNIWNTTSLCRDDKTTFDICITIVCYDRLKLRVQWNGGWIARLAIWHLCQQENEKWHQIEN